MSLNALLVALPVNGKPIMILVLLRHTPNPSSKFIDLDIEIPFARGAFAKFESSL